MSVARLRALTPSFVKKVSPSPCRNECCPFEGIDTRPSTWRKQHTPSGRNECCPFEGIDTVREATSSA